MLQTSPPTGTGKSGASTGSTRSSAGYSRVAHYRRDGRDTGAAVPRRREDPVRAAEAGSCAGSTSGGASPSTFGRRSLQLQHVRGIVHEARLAAASRLRGRHEAPGRIGDPGLSRRFASFPAAVRRARMFHRRTGSIRRTADCAECRPPRALFRMPLEHRLRAGKRRSWQGVGPLLRIQHGIVEIRERFPREPDVSDVVLPLLAQRAKSFFSIKSRKMTRFRMDRRRRVAAPSSSSGGECMRMIMFRLDVLFRVRCPTGSERN